MSHLNRALIVALVGPAILVACGRASAPPAEQKTETAVSGYVPSATFQELMDSVVDPAADQLWNAVSFRSDETGTHEIKPTTAEEWRTLRRAAVTLVESANLMAVPGRRVAVGNTTVEGEALETVAIQKRLDEQHEQLVALAAAMRDVGSKLVAASDRQDVAALTELGGTLDTVCESCHRVFWYPGQPPIDQP